MRETLKAFLDRVEQLDGTEVRKEVYKEYLETKQDLRSVGISNTTVLNDFALDITQGQYGGLLDTTELDFGKLRILKRFENFHRKYRTQLDAVDRYARGEITYDELRDYIEIFKKINEKYLKAQYV